MFARSAQFYDALYHFKDYAAAAGQLHTLIQETCPGATTLLDVACGTGKHLEYLCAYYRVEGLDLNAKLLEIARKRLPGSVIPRRKYGRFQPEPTSQARWNAFVEPWFSPENYWTGRLTANFVDQPELKIAWMYVSELQGRTSVFDIHYLVGTPYGIDHLERHEMGLFTHAEYLEAFRKCGLDVRHDPTGLFGRGMYTGVDQNARGSDR
jgi:SAM-dependent methyltransferase